MIVIIFIIVWMLVRKIYLMLASTGCKKKIPEVSWHHCWIVYINAVLLAGTSFHYYILKMTCDCPTYLGGFLLTLAMLISKVLHYYCQMMCSLQSKYIVFDRKGAPASIDFIKWTEVSIWMGRKKQLCHFWRMT